MCVCVYACVCVCVTMIDYNLWQHTSDRYVNYNYSIFNKMNKNSLIKGHVSVTNVLPCSQ